MQYLCALDDVFPGEGLRVATVSPPVAVFRTEDDEVYVLDDTCTHQDASLADGYVEGCWVECPLHESRFDLRSGAVDAPPAKRPVRSHVAQVVDGEVWVELSMAAPNLPPGVLVGMVSTSSTTVAPGSATVAPGSTTVAPGSATVAPGSTGIGGRA